MATYYVVGGGTAGNVFLSSASYFSLTSGGAGGAGVPTDVDDVIFNTASGTNFLVFDSLTCRTLTIAASTAATFNNNSFNIYGSFLNSSTVVNINTISINAVALSGSWTITTANRPISSLQFGNTFTTASYALGSALTVNALIWLSGNFSTANFTITENGSSSRIYIDGGPFNSHTINFGSSIINMLNSGYADIVGAIQLGVVTTVALGTSVWNLGSQFNIYGGNSDPSPSTGLLITSGASQIKPSSFFLTTTSGTITLGTVNANTISIDIGRTSLTTGVLTYLTAQSNYITTGTSASTTGIVTIAGLVFPAGSSLEVYARAASTTINGAITVNSLYIGANDGALIFGGAINNSSFTSINAFAGSLTTSSITTNDLSFNSSSSQAISLGTVTINTPSSRAFTPTLNGSGTVTFTQLQGTVGGGLLSISLVGTNPVVLNGTYTTATRFIDTLTLGGEGNKTVSGVVTCNSVTASPTSPGVVTFSNAVTSNIANISAEGTGSISFANNVTAPNLSIGLSGTLNNVSFTTGTVTATTISINNSGTLALGATTFIAPNSFTIATTPATTTVGTSIVRVGNFVSGALTTGTLNTPGTGANFNTVQLQGDIITSTGAFTCATLSRTSNANNRASWSLTDSVTVTGTGAGALTITGNSAVNRSLVQSPTKGTPVTLSAGAVSLTNVDFSDITAAGTATWTGTSLGNWLGNTGITFTAPTTRYAVAAGNWNSTAVWSATNGGASGASVPLAQDNVIINNLSGAGVITSTVTRALGANISIQSGYAGSVSFNDLIPENEYVNGIFGNITIANEIDVSTVSAVTVEYATRGTLDISYGNRTQLSAVLTGPENVNFLSDIGSPLYKLNTFVAGTGPYSDVLGGTVNTNGNTIHSSFFQVPFSKSSVDLSDSDIFCYGEFVVAGLMSPNTATLHIMDSDASYSASNNNQVAARYIKDVVYYKTFGNPTLNGILYIYGGTFTDKRPSYVTTVNYNLTNISELRFSESATMDIGNGNVYVTIQNALIRNNTSLPLQTKKALYRVCIAVGSFSGGSDVIAFGLADLGSNSGILFPSPTRTIAFSGASASSFQVPANFSGAALVEAIGGGAAGSTVTGAGGAGAYSESLFLGTFTRGQTLFVSSTVSQQNAWLNTINTLPSSATLGILARGTSSRTGGSASLGVFNSKGYTGGSGGVATGAGGSGGGSAASRVGNGLNAGSGGSSRTVNNGGSGGAGINGASSNVTSQNGTAGGLPSGGTAGTGGASNTAGGNATAGLGGGGGGGGGGYSATTSTKTGTYSRASASTTLTMNITNHQMTNGSTYSFTFSPFRLGTYSKTSSLGTAATTITVSAGHGLSNGQIVYIDFTSGNLSARDGYYTITFISATQFSVIASPALTTTASGNISLFAAPTGTSFAVSVVNSNQITVTTTSTCVIPATAVSSVVTVINFDNPGKNGGLGASSSQYTYDVLNGVAVSGTIGPGGGGGGGSASSGFAGGNGGSGGVGAGGGAGGTGTTSGTSGSGGSGLVLFKYALTTTIAPQGFIIG
jgi:hypothetical protein